MLEPAIPADCGKTIQARREELGWSRKLLASLYGMTVFGRPVTEKAIELMEEHNKVPRNMRRRYILAQILGLAPTVLGLPALERIVESVPGYLMNGPLDTEEYKQALVHYREKHHSGTAIHSLKKIRYRISRLQDAYTYTFSEEKQALGRVLCGYLMLMGNVAKDHLLFDVAVNHLNNGVILAKESKFYDLLAAALYRRGGVFFDRASVTGNSKDLHHAIWDFFMAQSLEPFIPPRMYGTILVASSCMYAHVAEEESDMTQALEWMDEAEKFMKEDNGNEDEHLVKIDEGQLPLDRASAFLASPLPTLRNPSNALASLASITADAEPMRHHAYGDILHAQAAFEQGDYTMATMVLTGSLSVAGEVQSEVNIVRADRLYGALMHTPHRNSADLAKLRVELVRVKHPALLQ